MAISI